MNKLVHTKTFKSGNSVAVRLPKGFAIPDGADVELEKSGDLVTVRLKRYPDGEKAEMLAWLDELKAMPKPPKIMKRERVLFPKRPGL